MGNVSTEFVHFGRKDLRIAVNAVQEINSKGH
jgi:hypothetical protein